MRTCHNTWLAIGALSLLLLVACTYPVVAQDNPPQTPPSDAAPAASEQKSDDVAPELETEPPYRFAVEVDVVNVRATVLDERSRSRDGLKREDFQIFENGQAQKISFFSHDQRVPVSVGILVDASGSMKYKIQQALQTVREIGRALWPQDEMFLISFNSDVRLRSGFTNDAERMEKPLREIKAGGETAMYDAINRAIEEMKTAKNEKRILFLITDGFDTRSRVNSAAAEELLKRSNVTVYAIGIDDDTDDPSTAGRTRYHIYHHAFNRLTSVSGGRAFRMITGRTVQLPVIAQLLVDELHQHYTLGYYPSSPSAPSGWRQVEVKINKPDAHLWYRPGYYVDLARRQANK